MENGVISHRQITASSEWNADQAAFQGRLHFQATAIKKGGWAPVTSDSNQWLQVDLGSRYAKVARVATQGRNNYSQWVTKYKLKYGNDGVNFHFYREHGQTADKVCSADYLRWPPLNYNGHLKLPLLPLFLCIFQGTFGENNN